MHAYRSVTVFPSGADAIYDQPGSNNAKRSNTTVSRTS